MVVSPKLKVTRFAQTAPGDLFLYTLRDQVVTAMTVINPASDGNRQIAVIGPPFPPGMTRPSLVDQSAATVVSFGKEYVLRLPAQAEGWLTAEPVSDVSCIVLTDKGQVFFRVNYGPMDQFRACYVNIESGEIQTDRDARQYITPPCIRAFAVSWQIVTTEEKGREILSYQIAQVRT